jgi:hypothetical protein
MFYLASFSTILPSAFSNGAAFLVSSLFVCFCLYFWVFFVLVFAIKPL